MVHLQNGWIKFSLHAVRHYYIDSTNCHWVDPIFKETERVGQADDPNLWTVSFTRHFIYYHGTSILDLLTPSVYCSKSFSVPQEVVKGHNKQLPMPVILRWFFLVFMFQTTGWSLSRKKIVSCHCYRIQGSILL